MKKYYLYILSCSDASLYTGITTDVNRRLRQHNGEIVGGAKYTQNRRPVELVHTEIFDDRSSASKHEALIKKMTRTEKDIYIKRL